MPGPSRNNLNNRLRSITKVAENRGLSSEQLLNLHAILKEVNGLELSLGNAIMENSNSNGNGDPTELNTRKSIKELSEEAHEKMASLLNKAITDIYPYLKGESKEKIKIYSNNGMGTVEPEAEHIDDAFSFLSTLYEDEDIGVNGGFYVLDDLLTNIKMLENQRGGKSRRRKRKNRKTRKSN